MNEVFRKKPSKQRDMLLVDNNGDFHIILQSDADELKALLSSDTLTFPNVFNFGPALVVDGNVCEIPDYYKNKYNVFADEPRCAIGQIGELEYLLVAAARIPTAAPARNWRISWRSRAARWRTTSTAATAR